MHPEQSRIIHENLPSGWLRLVQAKWVEIVNGIAVVFIVPMI